MREVTILIPTMDTMITIILWYYIIGMIPWFVHTVSFVWCDYGRYVSKMSLHMVIVMSLIDLTLWPLNMRETRQNLRGFNRDVNYYR